VQGSKEPGHFIPNVIVIGAAMDPVDDDIEPMAPPSTSDDLKAEIEAALVAIDEPLTARHLAELCGAESAAAVENVLRELSDEYDRLGSALQMVELAGGYQLMTRPEFHPWLVRMGRVKGPVRLSSAASEALAIIAYRQPIMRADIEAIRGVQSSEVLHVLMEKGLVRIVGRHESLGRPVLYGTTKRFMQVFGLKSLSDLPAIDS
jgi:segregation and condensation protein B